MDDEYPKGSDYYWEQAARLIARSKSALTPEHSQLLLLLSRRWERLALKAATAEQTEETFSGHRPQNVTELEIYRAANQLIRLFPRDADAEASRRSRRAYELGDITNFHLWARIARAAMELGRKTSRGTPVN